MGLLRPSNVDGRVEDVSCRFTGPDTVLISWSPPSSVEADGYEVVRGATLVAAIGPGEFELIDNDPLPFDGRLHYSVRTIVSGEFGGSRSCAIDHDPDASVTELRASFSAATGDVELGWENQGSYVGVTVFREGEKIAVLPGNAVGFTDREASFGEDLVLGYTVHAVGETFVTTPQWTYAEKSVNPFLRGDVNQDGGLSVSDGVMLRRFLFDGDPLLACVDAADVDDDGAISITDALVIWSYIFLDDSEPQSPFPEVGLDPTGDSLSCGSYSVVVPEETSDLVEFDEIEGAPGQEVKIPVFLTNSVGIEAFQLVLTYDPEIFTPRELSFEGTFYGERGFDGPFRTVTADPAAGLFTVALVPSLGRTGFETPPGTERLVFEIAGTISPSAVPGTVISLGPTTTAPPLELRSELTYLGEARFISVVPRVSTAMMRIIPDVLIFRGDSNDDGTLDIADATYTLGWIFVGGQEPSCPDAVDANDDGLIDISDPVAVLHTLFLGISGIAPPFPQRCGVDLIRDELPDCESHRACGSR